MNEGGWKANILLIFAVLDVCYYFLQKYTAEETLVIIDNIDHKWIN